MFLRRVEEDEAADADRHVRGAACGTAFIEQPIRNDAVLGSGDLSSSRFCHRVLARFFARRRRRD